MATATLIFYILAFLMAVLMFFMKPSGLGTFGTLLTNIVVKVGSIYVILYSAVQLFIHFGLIKLM